MIVRLAGMLAGALCLGILLAGPGARMARAEPALQAERVPFCVDPDWAPYEIINERGEHEGIAADLLRLVAERAGIGLRLVWTRDWEESVAAARAGRCEMLSFLNQTPGRDEWLLFTDPLFLDTNAVITREEHAYVDDLAGLAGETIALPRGTSIEEWVRRDFPDLVVLTTESEAEAFALVSERKADLTIRSLTVAVYAIKKDGWFNLKIAGQVPGYRNALRIGVRKDKPALRDALNRGVATLTPRDMREAANRHTAFSIKGGTDYTILRNVVIAFSLVLLTSLIWAFKLKQVNERLRVLSETDPLTGLANRARLNEAVQAELERARRSGRPFAVILFDLDHFKAVNDDFGHLVGDRVLTDFSRILSTHIRRYDMAGRWGGEEFLILCPDTDAASAATLAQRICQTVRGHAFETGRRQSVSAGVAACEEGSGPENLIGRADQALYGAKEAGRDRVLVG